MRCTTLKASAGHLDGLLAYYAGLAEDRDRPGPFRGPVDYYLDPDEPAGRWWGRGQPALGMSGEVAGEELRSMLEARDLYLFDVIAALRKGDPPPVPATAGRRALLLAYAAIEAHETGRRVEVPAPG